MLSPSNLYSYASGYFFYTSDYRYFSIYFTTYTAELEENGTVISRDFIMIGFNLLKIVPSEFENEDLTITHDKPSEEIDNALESAIQNYFAAAKNEPLLYLLSTGNAQHKARTRRFGKVADKLQKDITIVNYEFDDESIPDTGFMILSKNPHIDNLNKFFNKYVRQFYGIDN